MDPRHLYLAAVHLVPVALESRIPMVPSLLELNLTALSVLGDLAFPALNLQLSLAVTPMVLVVLEVLVSLVP